MSVTMSKTDGVTVFTLTSDPQSSCPALCQILRGLCYNPLCCSVSQHLRRVQRSSQSALGALHIMVGLLNIGFGLILFTSDLGTWWGPLKHTGYPFWFGAVFVIFGVMSILSEKLASPCVVIINVILNLAGVGFAITAIILYSINITDMWIGSRCYYGDYSYGYRSQYNGPTQSPQQKFMRERCLEGRRMALMLMKSINAVLIVLSVLELCVAISSAVMGIKTLMSREKRDNKSTDDPQHYKTLLEDVTSNPTV